MRLVNWLVMVMLIIPGAAALSVDTFDDMTYKHGETIHFSSICYNESGEMHATCQLRVYDAQQNLTVNETYIGAYDIINLSKGDYRYQVLCNTSSELAAGAGSFAVTFDGTPKTNEPSVFLAVIILVPMILSMLLLYGAMHMQDEHIALKIMAYLFSGAMSFATLGLGLVLVIRFYVFDAFQDLIGLMFWLFGAIMFFVITYLVLWLFRKLIMFMAQKKDERMEY